MMIIIIILIILTTSYHHYHYHRHHYHYTAPMDCSQEIITAPGREASNFLSLDAYFPPDSFTRLGHSIGGFGFYQSASLT